MLMGATSEESRTTTSYLLDAVGDLLDEAASQISYPS